ncbi:MAG: glycine cleavage system aminomethyltransferase GcvT [Planctomycetota bacterium]|nr:glycine cleavage system aminomethyltransferase GcvT [Planctomycetota bacterium]
MNPAVTAGLVKADSVSLRPYMRETALKNRHAELGARLVPFAGWAMPVQYEPILDEVRTVRTTAGLFDLGHMGRVRIRGPQAEDFLQRLQTNDAAKIAPGRIRYAMILDNDGLTQDDVLVYRDPEDDSFFLVINAGNSERDLNIMHEVAAGLDVSIIDQTEELGMLAIQGRESQQITQQLTDVDLATLKYYGWARGNVLGTQMEISRTGYTGEDGFEIYVPQAQTCQLWEAFMEAGKNHGLRPTGLGARDTLRLEAGMPLYGHEIDETTNPLEAGLEFAVKFTHDFVGREALERVQQAGGTGRQLVGLTSKARRCPRQGYEVTAGDNPIGKVCSGSISPTLDLNVATAYVQSEFAEPGTELSFRIKDKTEPCTVTSLPFYKRQR